MIHYNKVRGILRAKNGSQFPKYIRKALNGMLTMPAGYDTASLLAKDTSGAIASLKSQQATASMANNFNKYSQIVDVARGFIGAQPKSETTARINQGYDAIANAAMMFTPVGTIVGGAMKVGGLVGDALNAVGLGTDQMTATDLILDSNFMKLSPISLVNSALAKKTRSFAKDTEVEETVGSSYGGSMNEIDKAVSKAGKKYGFFSSKARRKANSQIAEAERKQNIMSDITDETQTRNAMANNQTQLQSLNYQYNLSGGPDYLYMRAAKLGAKIDLVKSRKFKLIVNVETKQVEEFKDGGIILNLEWKPEIVEEKILLNLDLKPTVEFFLEGGKATKKSRTIEELIEYAKKENPRFILRMSEPIKDLDLGDGKRGTHLMSWGDDGKGTAFVYALILEDENGNLINYGKKALDRAIEKGNYLKMSPEEAELFTLNYKLGWPQFFEYRKSTWPLYEYKDGGKTKNKYPQEYVDFINSVKLYAPNLGELEPEGYNMFRYWELNGKPKNWLEATHNNGFGLKPSMFEFIPGDSSYHARSIAFNLDTGEYEWMKHKNHNTAWMEKAFYDGYDYETDEKGFPIFDESLPEYEGFHPILKKKTGEALKESENFRNNYDLVEDENGYRKYVPKKKLFKQGGKTSKKFDENLYPLVTIKEEPWADNFFKQHPEVSGMAIGGGLNGVEGSRRVILNPYAKNINKDSVIKNERLRHWMEEVDFQLPEISKELFEKYLGTPYENDTLNIGRTEAARYLSGDSNLLTPVLKEYILGFKQGGKTKQELEAPEIEETTQKNLIPEGALHKNKHHIEHTDGLTLKGIPVVDNEGNQQAEIEHSEIIFTLEVTKKLEELYKEGTDEAAIEAGKLLVKEILFNTDDRTDLILKCEKGGKINDVE